MGLLLFEQLHDWRLWKRTRLIHEAWMGKVRMGRREGMGRWIPTVMTSVMEIMRRWIKIILVALMLVVKPTIVGLLIVVLLGWLVFLELLMATATGSSASTTKILWRTIESVWRCDVVGMSATNVVFHY
jgi:hypothetical protein